VTYDYLTDTDLAVLAELAAEEVTAWAALAHPLDCDYEPDLDDYEVQQALYQG